MMTTTPTCTITNALTSLENYWTNVLKLPGVPNMAARDLTNYTVVDNYVALKKVQESRVLLYD